MVGTRRTVVFAIVRIPPTITRPTRTASSVPTSQALSASSALPVTSTTMAVAWLDWNMLPMPRQPITMLAA